MYKKTVRLSTRQLNFISKRYAYILQLLLMVTSTSLHADLSPCLEEYRQLQQALTLQRPSSPRVMNDVINLQHVGMKLCHQGNAAKGKTKLTAALNKVNPQGMRLPFTIPQRADK